MSGSDLSSDDLLTSAQVRASLGNISDMTLWRWTRDLGFPAPDLVINRRKFWCREAVQRWLSVKRAGNAKTAAPPKRGEQQRGAT